jgi:hypothetical protein
MRREEVLDVARAAARVVGVRRVLIVGSQAVLGSHAEDELPATVLSSIEADVVILDDPDGTAPQAVEASLGYMSLFHTTHGYYAEGVEWGTAVLPDGWEGRVLTLTAPAVDGDVVAVHFPELHDLCISKLVAARIKDRAFVDALWGAGLLDGTTLVRRAESVSGIPAAVRNRTVELAVARRDS